MTNFIEDDDGTGSDRALFVSSPVIVEGDSGTLSAVFEVAISEPYATTKTFDFRTEDGTAIAGSDYTATSGTLTFTPGARTVEISVPVSGDTAVEASENFRLIVNTDNTIADGGIGAVGEATLLDDDAGGTDPVLSFSVESADESGAGYGGSIIITTRLSQASNDAVTVSYRAVGETADRQVDFPFVDGEVTFAPGETVKITSFQLVRDNFEESDQSLVVEMFNVTGASLAGNAPVLRETAFILDDDGVGLDRGLHVSSPVVTEGDDGTQRALFEVTLSRPATETLTFDYATQDAGTVAGSDYTAKTGTITFAPGQTRASVDVIVAGDELAEFTEAFQLVVTPTSAIGDGGAGAVGEAIILDDDTGGALPTLSLLAGPLTPNVTDDNGAGYGGTVTRTVILSEPSNDAVTVGYRTIPLTAQNEIDFPRVTDTLTFAPGETVKTIDIAVIREFLDEDDEAFALEFFDAAGAVFAGGTPVLRDIGFIIDDDGVGLDRSLQVSSPVLIEGDDGSQTARFEVYLSRPSDSAQTFEFMTQDGSAQAGTDYTSKTGTITFQPGQTFAVVDVAVAGDDLSEDSEFFQLVITPTTALGDAGAGVVGQATLVDDDGEEGLPTLSISASNGPENGSGYGVTIDWIVTLSAPAADEVTVQYRGVERTAKAGVDFPEFTDTLTFAPGVTSMTISHQVSTDNIDEADESFAVELFDPAGAVLAGGAPVLQEAAFILDDDGVGLNRAIHVSDVDLYEPEEGSATATFVITLSRPFDGATTLAYSTVSGTAVAGADFTAKTGSVTFAPGQTEAAVIVEVLSDALNNEGTEQFSLSLTAPLPSTLTGGPEGSLGTATILQPAIPPIAATGEVTFTGALNVGQELTADTSGIEDENGLGEFSLQWFRGETAIEGATALSYTLAQADVSSEISLEVSFVDGIGTEETISGVAGSIGIALPTDGDDNIVGTAGDDVISGGAGNDTLNGGDGDDTIAGSAGADSIDGGAGNDFIGGGTDDDFILGSDGSDTIGSGLGDDTADGGAGDDGVYGGGGNDLLSGGSGNDTLGASFGNDTVSGDDGNDSLGGGTGRDELDGGTGDDSIGGGEGDDIVTGGTGDDFIAGGGRNDVMDGGTGNDRINGGDGDDTMTGGDGADVFIYNFFKDGDADVVLDFEDGVDTFRLVGVENAPGTGLDGKLAALNITDTDDGALMNYDGHTVLVTGMDAADLGIDDFVFI